MQEGMYIQNTFYDSISAFFCNFTIKTNYSVSKMEEVDFFL